MLKGGTGGLPPPPPQEQLVAHMDEFLRDLPGRRVSDMTTAPSKHTAPAIMNGAIHTSGCPAPCAASLK